MAVMVLLTGCEKTEVTTPYTIGCLSFHTSTVSDWVAFEEYMASVVTYNEHVYFTGSTLDDNDVAAADFFLEECQKVDVETACSYIGGSDFLTYGIARTDESGETKVIASVTYTAQGVQ